MKHVYQLFQLFAVLAPLAVGADIAAPPNDYTRFLYRGGHYVGMGGIQVGSDVGVSILCGACVAVGIVLLAWLCTRRKSKKLLPMEYVVLAVLVGSAVTGGVLVWQNVLHGLDDFAYGNGDGHLRPKLQYKDSPELRAEYDRKCIEYYNSYKASTNWPKIIMHQLGKDAPIMRPDAPEAVTNAYLRYRRELSKTVFVP
jgi:hypothetical protein